MMFTKNELLTRIKESKVFGESQMEGVAELFMMLLEPVYDRISELEKKKSELLFVFAADDAEELEMARALVVRLEEREAKKAGVG